MSQIVGLRCALCQETIGSITEGEFCRNCRSPSHHGCRKVPVVSADTTHCPVCGADVSALLATQTERRRAVVEAQKRGPAARVVYAIICLELLAAPFLLLGLWLFFAARKSDPEFALYIGGVFLVVASFIQATAIALYKGSWLARLAAIALFMLTLPSVGLPVAVFGLIMLWDGRRWNEYVTWRRETKA